MSAQSLTLTERLADRLCHDFASSAQAVASGLDLLREASSPAERDEAEAFLAVATAAQKAKIAYARRAYGPAPDPVATAELEGLVGEIFRDIRPGLVWRVSAPAVGPLAARALLVLGQLAADILAAGGTACLDARKEEGAWVVETDAEGPRPRVSDDLRAGLTGAPGEASRGGRWAQGAFLRTLAEAGGGEVRLQERPHGVRILISLPSGG